MTHTIPIQRATDQRPRLAAAIPPAYSEWIGRSFLASRALEVAA
jgi:hypothetical protein